MAENAAAMRNALCVLTLGGWARSSAWLQKPALSASGGCQVPDLTLIRGWRNSRWLNWAVDRFK